MTLEFRKDLFANGCFVKLQLHLLGLHFILVAILFRDINHPFIMNINWKNVLYSYSLKTTGLCLDVRTNLSPE